MFWGIEKCDGKTVEMRSKTGAAFGPFSIHECIQYDAYIFNPPGRCFVGTENATEKQCKHIEYIVLHLD